MTIGRLTLTASALGIISLPGHAGVLYDNGPVNGVNGYSNATSGVFGFRRTLLDDFTVPEGGWTIQDMEWRSVWGAPTVWGGSGIELSIRTDLDGTPGATIEVANLVGYSEVFTGNILFSREEVVHWASFSDIILGPGHYWFEGVVASQFGSTNNFWLTADQNNHECWVNYEDLNGLESGTDQFGEASDINFIFRGVPAPGVLSLLGVALLVRTTRRRT